MANIVNLTPFILIITLILNQTQSQSGNYAQQGQDWTGSCAVNGSTQSPFTPSSATNDQNFQNIYFEFDDWEGTLKFTANNYILKMDRPTPNNGRGVLKYKGVQCIYTALRFQFHAPGEHSVNYRYRDLEVQIIMKKDDDKCTAPAFVGLSFLFDSDIPKLNSFLNNLGVTDQAADAGNALVTGTAQITKLISDVKSEGFYTYTGSLTSGACEEVCLWLIAITQYKMTASQQKFFDNIWKDNSEFLKASNEGNNRVLMNKLHSKWYDHNRRSYSIPDARVRVENKSIEKSQVSYPPPKNQDSTQNSEGEQGQTTNENSAASLTFNIMILSVVALLMLGV